MESHLSFARVALLRRLIGGAGFEVDVTLSRRDSVGNQKM